jgi:viroplasmin and RNaseH domain-containing protein
VEIEWIKAKNKVKKAINEIAEDLVKLYAVRSTLKGYKFSKDTVWQKQFEMSSHMMKHQINFLQLKKLKLIWNLTKLWTGYFVEMLDMEKQKLQLELHLSL